jgi:hypothetical protein
VKWTREQALFLWAAALLPVTLTIVAQTAKPKRVNQAIELLAEGQPIYGRKYTNRPRPTRYAAFTSVKRTTSTGKCREG